MYDSCGVDFAMHAWLSCHNVVALGVIRFFFFFLGRRLANRVPGSINSSGPSLTPVARYSAS